MGVGVDSYTTDTVQGSASTPNSHRPSTGTGRNWIYTKILVDARSSEIWLDTRQHLRVCTPIT